MQYVQMLFYHFNLPKSILLKEGIERSHRPDVVLRKVGRLCSPVRIWFINCQNQQISGLWLLSIPSLILLDSLQSKNSVSWTFWKKPFVLLPILSFRKVFCYFFREAVKGSRGVFFATITHTTIRVGESIIFAPVFLLSSFFLSSRL